MHPACWRCISSIRFSARAFEQIALSTGANPAGLPWQQRANTGGPHAGDDVARGHAGHALASPAGLQPANRAWNSPGVASVGLRALCIR